MLLTSFKAPGPLVYFEQAAIKRVYIYPSLKLYFSFHSIYWTGIYPMEWNGNAANRFNTVLNFNGYFNFMCFCLAKKTILTHPKKSPFFRARLL